MGLVQSRNRPGGNVTSIANFEEIIAKKLQLLQEVAPAATRMGYLVDHKTSFWPGDLERVVDAGKKLGIEVVLLTAENAEEI
jgi:putative tryptophan/tyrosine transport system substrate-binding protein